MVLEFILKCCDTQLISAMS